ncbi:MAG TPA: prephenate dehydratase [bacterium]|nr:prephenate dehydratase [bacterium]
MTTLAYLGPTGTFTEQAARQFNPDADLLAQPTSADVMQAVKKGKANFGVIAIENMIHGMVRENLDLLYKLDLKVQGELILPIHHCLCAHPEHETITTILAHPQALAQCREWLVKKYPKATLEAVASNTAGMEAIHAHSLTNAAAIGPELAAAQYQLKILATSIEDFPDNVTRFWLIGPELNVQPEHNKFSIAYYFEKDKPGCLYESLGYFARENINLITIAVRPSAKMLGNYVFHLDLDGNLESEPVQFALNGLKRITDVLKVIGSYTRASV